MGVASDTARTKLANAVDSALSDFVSTDHQAPHPSRQRRKIKIDVISE